MTKPIKVKCPKNKKGCQVRFCMKAQGDKHFICGGWMKKPNKYIKDNIKLCLKGKYADDTYEMTKDEACIIIAALSLAMEKEVR